MPFVVGNLLLNLWWSGRESVNLVTKHANEVVKAQDDCRDVAEWLKKLKGLYLK